MQVSLSDIVFFYTIRTKHIGRTSSSFCQQKETIITNAETSTENEEAITAKEEIITSKTEQAQS